MSFYDDASWLLIPSGIEEDVVFAQKPTSGLGDLTFTRASDATYTDSTGVVRRSPYNLVQQSEVFTDAYWTKNATGVNTAIGTNGIQPNVAIAPNGTLTADRVNLIPNTSLLGITRLITAEASTTHSISLYVKGEGSDIGKTFSINMRRQTGSYLDTNVTVTLTGEWQRVIAPSLTLGAGNTGLDIRFYSSSTNNGASTALIWGAQLVEGTSALDYFPTTNRQDVPRIDFRNADGTLSSCGRLLLEPQRTNSIRNSSMVAAVAGSPGTLPTNYNEVLNGLTRSVVGVGTENGLPYFDIRFAGTATGTACEIRFESNIQIAALTGQAWTLTNYAKIISGTFNSSSLYIIERTSAGAIVTTGFQSVTLTSTLQRLNYTRTLSGGATVGAVQPAIVFFLTNGATYDFTIRIAAPQMELSAYPTTWVPTTTAAVTRIADSALKSGIQSLIGQQEGTFFVELQISVSDSQSIFAIDAGSIANYIRAIILSTKVVRVSIASGGVVTNIMSTPALSFGTHKIAVAYKSGDYAVYVDGVQSVTSASTTYPVGVLNQINLSTAVYGNLNDGIAQTALFPTRLTNDQLAQLTTL